jgi:hypothetical protein
MGLVDGVSRLRRVRWDYVASIAAMLLVVVGLWWMLSPRKPNTIEMAEKPRHELLNKEMAHVVKLAKADSAPGRLRVWTEWSSDLRVETKEVYQVAPAVDLSSLARMYDKAVNDGIVRQAKLLDRNMDPEERQTLLKAADAKLAEMQAEADRLQAEAPPTAQKYLKQISESSREARRQLDPLLKGV